MVNGLCGYAERNFATTRIQRLVEMDPMGCASEALTGLWY